MTTESKSPPLWPFLLVDALFLAVAAFIYQQAHRPLLWWEAGLLVLCAAAAAGAFLIPILRRAGNEHDLAQARKLADAVEKIQKLDELASQISNSTSQWQIVQDTAAKTAKTAAELSQSMAAEAKGFAEFLQKADDIERAHLRLEADKLRRSEAEWLQIVIRILDQVYALFQAALQSGQPALAEQIGHFQNTCRDHSRRMGVIALTAQPGEQFDPARHQLPNNTATPEATALIQETVAPGYSYQGRAVRRPLVRLQSLAVQTETSEKV